MVKLALLQDSWFYHCLVVFVVSCPFTFFTVLYLSVRWTWLPLKSPLNKIYHSDDFCFYYLLLTLSGDTRVFTLLYLGLVFQVDLHLATVSPVVQDDLQGKGQQHTLCFSFKHELSENVRQSFFQHQCLWIPKNRIQQLIVLTNFSRRSMKYLSNARKQSLPLTNNTFDWLIN